MPSSSLPEAWKQNAPDAALAALVLMIVAMMIVPLPTPLLDLLLTANIAIGVLMLLASMYVRSGLELSSFPTILLVTTLFRLSLNISSTRLVLLQADAGEVIRAFGDFVVRGNYVVGGVVFALLTLIQFLVIAKGSERVAEVGARFTLDAMPGKQMSIDAELRTGALDAATARKKRTELARESQFYGAMDGAMKFVKGDAIAGIVITFVNLLGGLLVGILMHGMDAGTSLRTYGLLTIGDGLVSQIPALLVSTSAGMVVTRVASEGDTASLGRDVARQVFGQPKPLAIAGVFLVVMALVPGLPALPFLVLGGLALGVARTIDRRTISAVAPKVVDVVREPRSFVPVVSQLSLDLSRDLEPALSADGPPLASALDALRSRIFADLGLVIPAVRVMFRDAFGAGRVDVAVQEVVATTIDVDPAADRASIEAAICRALEQAVRRHAEELIGVHETQELVDRLERIYPALVKNVLPKPVSLPLLSEVLRRLVGEGVNLRSLREILEALAIHAPAEKDPVELVELVRSSMRRQLTRGLLMDGNLGALLVDPTIEELVRDAIRRTPSGTFLALPPGAGRDVIASVKRALEKLGPGRPEVLLAQSDVRRFLRRLLEHELPSVRVIAYAELPPDVVVVPLGRVEP